MERQAYVEKLKLKFPGDAELLFRDLSFSGHCRRESAAFGAIRLRQIHAAAGVERADSAIDRSADEGRKARDAGFLGLCFSGPGQPILHALCR